MLGALIIVFREIIEAGFAACHSQYREFRVQSHHSDPFGILRYRHFRCFGSYLSRRNLDKLAFRSRCWRLEATSSGGISRC